MKKIGLHFQSSSCFAAQVISSHKIFSILNFSNEKLNDAHFVLINKISFLSFQLPK